MAALFIAGNMALPQLFHLIPQGGITWLPIYFFTLIGAYKFGWKVGLLTAVLSPVINSLLFGMPLPAVLPAILLKSVLLAAAAGWAAHRFNRISLPILLAVVLFYQVAGTLGEWAMVGSFFVSTAIIRADTERQRNIAGAYTQLPQHVPRVGSRLSRNGQNVGTMRRTGSYGRNETEGKKHHLFRQPALALSQRINGRIHSRL